VSAREVTLPERYQGGRGLVMGGAVGGLIFLAATFAGLAIDPRRTMFSYLVAWLYWAGIGLSAAILLMIFHAFGAKWVVVIRRVLEAMSTSVLLYVVLFIPIFLGLKYLYLWVEPPPTLPRDVLKLLAHKQPYLNKGFFLIRTIFYFAMFALVAGRLFRLSTKQDEVGGTDLTRRQRRFGTGMLPLMAMVFTFAAFDWVMSLNPLWYSTIFGVYFFAGSFVSVFAILAIAAHRARGANEFGAYVSIEHIHNIGKLMLSFVAFWAYVAFSQFMLIWIASLPEEIQFFLPRLKGEWAVVGWILILGQFLIPFGALLSRSLKRNRAQLAVVAAWILVIHFVDVYWLVLPTLSPESVGFHWTTITAFLGVGLLSISFTVWRMRGRFSIPVKDPYLAESLGYRQP
jgi:hypothetical protein